MAGALMRVRDLMIVAAFCSLAQGAAAQAPACVGLLQIPPNASLGLIEFIKSFAASKPPCGSGQTVLNQLLKRDKTGGRKLEPDAPFDEAKAQANLATALRNPAVKAQFSRAGSQIRDPAVLLAYEAAVLDDEGFYDARDLKLRQLAQRLAAL
jgi:hypothetical protein